MGLLGDCFEFVQDACGAAGKGIGTTVGVFFRGGAEIGALLLEAVDEDGAAKKLRRAGDEAIDDLADFGQGVGEVAGIAAGAVLVVKAGTLMLPVLLEDSDADLLETDWDGGDSWDGDYSAHDGERFGMSRQPLDQIADWQGYQQTCGVESGIENPVQAAYPWVGNDLSDEVIRQLPDVTTTGYPLNLYQDSLYQKGIVSEWVPMDHRTMFNTVAQPGCSVVVHGDPHFTNPDVFPSTGKYHTVFLSETWRDSAGNALGYIGTDSAPQSAAKRVCHWTFDQISQMVQGAPQNSFKGSVLLTKPAYPV